MSGLFSGAAGLLYGTGVIGGHASNTDRKQQLNSWGDLNKLFNFGYGQGTGQVKEGAGGLTKASNYFQTLMSGDRSQISQLLAPQVSNIQNQKQASMNTASEFGNRSGGTNAAVQASADETRKSVQSLIDMLGPEAAKAVADISAQQESLGTNLLNTAETSAATAGQQATDSRQLTEPEKQAQQAAGLQIGLTSLFGAAGG